MEIIVEKSYNEMSERAFGLIISEILKDKKVNLSLTSGNSPKKTYELLIDYLKNNKKLLSKVDFFNFDNIFLKGESIGDGTKAMNETLYLPAGIDLQKVHSITPDNYLTFDQKISNLGGLDLMLIGLGEDGHFCANMPYATNFLSETYEIPIEKKYSWYQTVLDYIDEAHIPKIMYSMGPRSLMKVKHLVMIVNGKSKAKAVHQFIESEITNSFPSSILKLHPNFTVILDEEAASEITDSSWQRTLTLDG